MKRIWAPWRMAYISGEEKDAAGGCVFCCGDRPGEDRQRLILRRGEHALVMMNRYPYSNGHLLVAPHRHLAELGLLTSDEALEIHHLTVECCEALKGAFAPGGFNIGFNVGQAAGAGVADHLHLHVVPRWPGDTNFMPVLDEVRVIPQHLEQTYDILAEQFSRRHP